MTKISQSLQSLALGVALLGSLAAPMAFAQPADAPAKPGVNKEAKCHKGKGHHGEHREKFMKELNLTDAQRQQMKAANEKFRKENAAAIENLKSKHQQLKALGDDAANASKKQALRAELKQERQTLMAKHKAAMQGILTPEQTSKMEAMKQQRKAQWAERRAKKAAPQQ